MINCENVYVTIVLYYMFIIFYLFIQITIIKNDNYMDSKKIVKEAKKYVYFAKERHIECVLVKKKEYMYIYYI